MTRRLLPWIVAVLVVLLDRVTKAAVLHCIIPGGLIRVVPGLALTNVRNPGIAFSLFADGGPVTRTILQSAIFCAVIFIAWMLYRITDQGLGPALAMGLILGGAAGNLLDRILYGSVVDFIHAYVHFGSRFYTWPDFNLADSAITIGAGLLILFELRKSKEKEDAPDPD